MLRLPALSVLAACLVNLAAVSPAEATPVLVVHGVVMRPDGSPAAGVRVSVTNVRRGLTDQAPKLTNALGEYGVAFVDYEADVADVADELAVQAMSGDTVVGQVTHRVTAAEVDASEVALDVVLRSPPAFTLRRSWVFEPDPDTKNGQVDPGERVEPRVRLVNEGPGEARDVTVSLSITDAAVTVVRANVTHAVWPAGEARNNDGFVLDIAPDAVPHDVHVVVNVVADGDGPWQFSFTLPVIIPTPVFTQRSAWVYDPPPDGYQDGEAEPGERVSPRIRLRNDGTLAATNLWATFVTADPDVTVVSGALKHATWPIGEARTLEGFQIDIAPTAEPHDVRATVSVTADSGGPWSFSFTFPIVPPTLTFALRNSWIFEPSPDTKNGQADPGERVHPRVRLANDGLRTAENVTVTLVIDDPAVTIVSGDVTHARWPAGEARNSEGFVLDIAPDAVPHDVDVVVNVTAYSGGPWRFAFSFPVVLPAPMFALRNAWIYDPEPHAYRDGVAEPGERVRPVVRLRNDGSGPATNVQATLEIADPAVTVIQAEQTWAEWPRDAAGNVERFYVDIAHDARPHDVAALVRVTADGGRSWRIPFTFPIAAPTVTFSQRSSWIFEPSDTTKNGQVDPGERVHPRVRLRNDGSRPAQDVTVTLTIDDPDVTIVVGEVAHAAWPAGEARNNDGFVLDVASDATPHDVDAAVDVTADNGARWRFTFTFPIAAPGLTFVHRNSWIFEPDAAMRNGLADPGERIEPRVRLINEGPAEGRNVTVALTIDDSDVTVVKGSVVHSSWPAGEARNNAGFALDIAPDAAPHDVAVLVDVTSEDGGPWQFSFRFPVAGAPALAVLSPTVEEVFPADATDVDLLVSVANHGGPWRWQLDAPFPDTGPAGGSAVLGATAATISGLASGRSYTVWVTLADTDGNVLDPALTSSVRFSIAAFPTLQITEPADGAVLDASSSEAVLSVEITDHPGAWRWRVNTDFPAVGPAGGTAATGPTAAIDALQNGQDYTVSVTLVDASGAVLDSRLTQSVRFSVDTWPEREITLQGVDVQTRNPTVQVSVGDGFQMAAATVVITYDAERFGLPSLVEDADIAGFGWTRNAGAQGAVTVRGASDAPLPEGDGELLLFTLEFVAKEDAKGDSDVEVDSVTLTDGEGDPIPATWPASETVSLSTPAEETRTVFLSDDWPGTWGHIKIAAGIPQATALHPNFPNPFNPETWIPFDLAEAADVVVTIYGSGGDAVRRLELGWLETGSYRARSQAARWDGLDSVGQAVASGVYIYELRARGHRQLRRLTVLK